MFGSERPLTPSAARVEISATRDPPAARELALVEAHGRVPGTTLASLISEFRARVVSAGGDFGRIDTFATTHETIVETYEYECGTIETEVQTRTVLQTEPDGSPTSSIETVLVPNYVQRTCTGARTVEVAILTLVGRALRASRSAP